MTLTQPTTRLKTTVLALVCTLVFTVGGLASGPVHVVGVHEYEDETSKSAADNEHTIKAVFIYKLIRWVTWPTSNLPKNSKKITIGVVGKDPFGKSLDKLASLKPIRGRKIKIKRFKSPSEVTKVQVLFVSKSLSKAEVKAVIANAHRDGILVIGEKKSFVDDGGMISLLIEKNKLKFEANTGSAKKAKIKISSQILKMASRVVK